jgi:tetratricopeptide (TPR) repeat protein
MLGVATLLLLTYAYAIWCGVADPRLPAPALVLALLAAYCLVQALPLPTWLLAPLAKGNIEVYRGLFEMLGERLPRVIPLSLDPGASRLEAVRWGAYAIAFALSSGLGARDRASTGAVIVHVSALVIALVTLGHRLAGAETVFGIYAPMGEFARTSIGPLLNPNNLAGYLNLGIFAGLGLMLTRQPPLVRWFLPLNVALLIGAVVESRSRGGLVALGIGLLALAPMAWHFRTATEDHERKRRTLIVIAATVVVGVGLAALAISPSRLLQGADSGLRKLAMASWVIPLIRDYPWFGVGRGAFESAFQQYTIGPDNLIYSHPENFVIQWAAEWGVPITLGMLVGLVALLRPRALGATRSPVALGALLAAVVLLLQNIVDLGTEVPALCIAALVGLGSCWGNAGGVQATEPGRRWRRPGAVLLLVGAALTLLSVLIWPVEPVGAARARIDQRLEELEPRDSQQIAGLEDELRRTMRAHPADAYFPRLAALVAFRQHDGQALRWIGRALELGPSSGRSHLLLARMLSSSGHESQALLELRLAATYDPGLSAHVAKLALQLSKDVDKLVRTAPQGVTGFQVLVAMAAELKDPSALPLRAALLRGAVERAPQSPVPRRHLAKLLLFELERDREGTLCAAERRQDCIHQVEEAAATLERLLPGSPEGVELRGRLLVATGRSAEASALLSAACEQFELRRSCLVARLKAAVAQGDLPTTQSATEALANQACQSVEDCADLLGTIADILARAGKRDVALAYYTRAAREDGSDARWLRVADLASELGQHALAVQALSSVQARRSRPDAKLQARLDSERTKAILPQQP